MLRLGLTGGIASGKSTVSAILRESGFPVLEADSMAHQLTKPGTSAYAEIVREFGGTILSVDQKIDRPALARIVFGQPEKLQRLNAIVHPGVAEQLKLEFEKLQSEGLTVAAFVEAALVYEAGLDQELDGVVVVWCTPEQQLARLISRGLSEEDAQSRIDSQLPVAQKLSQATETIDCSRSLAETRRQVEQLATKLRAVRPIG